MSHTSRPGVGLLAGQWSAKTTEWVGAIKQGAGDLVNISEERGGLSCELPGIEFDASHPVIGSD